MNMRKGKNVLSGLLVVLFVMTSAVGQPVYASKAGVSSLAAPTVETNDVATIRKGVTGRTRLLALVPLVVAIMIACERDFMKDGGGDPNTINGHVFTQEVVDFDNTSNDAVDYATIEHRRDGVLYMTTWIVYKKGTNDPVSGMSYPMTENAETGKSEPAFSGKGWEFYLESEKIKDPVYYEKYVKPLAEAVSKGEKEALQEADSVKTMPGDTIKPSVDTTALNGRSVDTSIVQVQRKRETIDFKEAFVFYKQTLRKRGSDTMLVSFAEKGKMKLWYETAQDSLAPLAQQRVFLMEQSSNDTVQNTFVIRYDNNGTVGQIIGTTRAGERIVVQGDSIYNDTLIYYQQSATFPIRQFSLSGGRVKPLFGQGPSKSLAKKLRYFTYQAFKYSGINFRAEIVSLRSA